MLDNEGGDVSLVRGCGGRRVEFAFVHLEHGSEPVVADMVGGVEFDVVLVVVVVVRGMGGDEDVVFVKVCDVSIFGFDFEDWR